MRARFAALLLAAPLLAAAQAADDPWAPPAPAPAKSAPAPAAPKVAAKEASDGAPAEGDEWYGEGVRDFRSADWAERLWVAPGARKLDFDENKARIQPIDAEDGVRDRDRWSKAIREGIEDACDGEYEDDLEIVESGDSDYVFRARLVSVSAGRAVFDLVLADRAGRPLVAARLLATGKNDDRLEDAIQDAAGEFVKALDGGAAKDFAAAGR